MSASPQILLVDQASLTIFKNTSSILHLWAQAIECYLCDPTKVLTVKKNSGESVIFESDKSWNLILRDYKNSTICSTSYTFGEHGSYHWHANDSSCSDILVFNPAQDPLKPIFITTAALFISLILWRYCKCLYYTRALLRRQPSENVVSEVESDVGFPDDVQRLLRPIPVQKEKTHRIKSLDVFRGITLSFMIFINYGGGEYWFFEHSPWNGMTIADVIFPWFAWIMGMSIAIKVKSELRNSVKRWDVFKKICVRSLILISLGIIVTNLRNDDLNTIRIPGVLQRLGVAYFIAAALESQFMNPQPILQDARYSAVEDLLESYYQWCVVLLLIVIHSAITFFLPVPNCPSGYLGPGGIYDHSSNFNCTGGAAGYIDRLVITETHLYQNPTCQKLYKCSLPYDPEGLLGVLTTVLCVYLGVHAGRIILVFKTTSERIKRWLMWSFVTGLTAVLLCDFSKEGGFIPVNKNLWSLSYVLLSSSFAFSLISILLFVIDKKTWWNGTPFYQVGMNSILLYIGHVVTKNTIPWQWKVIFDRSTHLEYFIQDVWATLLWVFIAVLLHKRKIFVTV